MRKHLIQTIQKCKILIVLNEIHQGAGRMNNFKYFYQMMEICTLFLLSLILDASKC